MARARRHDSPDPEKAPRRAKTKKAARSGATPGGSSLPGETLWSLGTSNRSLASFFSCLRGAGVRRIADVRRFPTSQRYPQFSRERLAASAREAGIEYVEMGAGLGGFRSGGYARFRRTKAFREGLRALEHCAREAPTCLLCAERVPSRCHRLEIARAMEDRGWRIIHLLDEETTWSPEAAP